MYAINTLRSCSARANFAAHLLSQLCPCFSSTTREREGEAWQTKELLLPPMRDQDVVTLEQSTLFFSAHAALLQ